MSEYSEFFLNSKSSVVQVDCIEISHSSFTQTYRVVRNNTEGVTVTHEDDTDYDYEYYPFVLSASGVRDDLDQMIHMDFGDLGEIIPQEIDAVKSADNTQEYPRVVYRTYRSDDLENVLYGPVVLEVRAFNFNREGCSFEAKAPSLNVNRTGEAYSLPRFPALRGLL